MPIANVTLNNTFDEWRTTTNQLIAKGDQLEITLNSAFSTANSALSNTSGAVFAGDLIITGNLTLSGPTAVLNLL